MTLLSDACGRKLNTYLPDYVVFDLETTGTSCYSDAVVEISAVKVKGGSVVDEFTTLVNPERHIPGFVVGIHGISDDMVKDSPCFREALSDFLDFAGDEVFVGHNIQSFDLKFLYRDAQNYWGKTIGNDYIDTLSFARKVLKGLDHYRLSDLADYYDIPVIGAHRALNDCRMNQQVFEHLAKELAGQPQFCTGTVSPAPADTIDGVLPGILPGTLRCPRCGSSLIKRNGRFGEFWGCLNFPDCKFTRDAKK